jgi:hypothetical protein
MAMAEGQPEISFDSISGSSNLETLEKVRSFISRGGKPCSDVSEAEKILTQRFQMVKAGFTLPLVPLMARFFGNTIVREAALSRGLCQGYT